MEAAIDTENVPVDTTCVMVTTMIRLQFDSATTVRRPTSRSYGAVEIRLIIIVFVVVKNHMSIFPAVVEWS